MTALYLLTVQMADSDTLIYSIVGCSKLGSQVR